MARPPCTGPKKKQSEDGAKRAPTASRGRPDKEVSDELDPYDRRLRSRAPRGSVAHFGARPRGRFELLAGAPRAAGRSDRAAPRRAPDADPDGVDLPDRGRRGRRVDGEERRAPGAGPRGSPEDEGLGSERQGAVRSSDGVEADERQHRVDARS